jgi:hypothetical protein
LKTLPLCMLFLAQGCGIFSKEKDASVELLSRIEPQWFNASVEHALHNQEGRAAQHLFFDVDPELGAKKNTANVVVITPENSPHAYELDLLSGQRFYSHSYCPQADAWGKRPGTFERPNFSIAVMPRVLDQLGEPQRVIVLGQKKKFAKHVNEYFHNVRLIAAYIEQTCAAVVCKEKNNWVSRLVFVGVDAEDNLLSGIKDIDTMGFHFNWENISGHLENIDGRSSSADSAPLNRVGKLIPFDEAFAYFRKNAIILDPKEMTKVATGCHKLYDKLWSDVGEKRPEDKPAVTSEELKEKLLLIQKLRAQNKPASFRERLIKFTENYQQEIATCSRFIYAGNINQHSEKYWFLSYMGIFYRLHKEGFYYGCTEKSWLKNTLTRDGTPLHDLKRDLKDCSIRDIDEAMARLPAFLKGLKSERNFYRFIDYDTHSMGSYRKMYSWVKIKSRQYDCNPDPNTAILKELRVAPEEAAWPPREVKDGGDAGKVIF